MEQPAPYRGTPPGPEGVSQWDKLQAAAPCRAEEPTAACRALSELAGDYAFFHHGLLHTAGGLDRDVLALHRERTGCSAEIHLFERPLFSGVGTGPDGTPWDSVLGLVPHAEWPALRAYLHAATIVDRARRTLVLPRPQPLRLVDPVMRRLAVVPPVPHTVEITFFGLDASWGTLSYREHTATWDALPQPRRGPARPTTRLLAGALLAERPRPHEPLDELFESTWLASKPSLKVTHDPRPAVPVRHL